jgi:CRISPR/Cas system-associated endonuclease Cas1
MAKRAGQCISLEELLGIEGNGAWLYFGAFAGMVKQDFTVRGAAGAEKAKKKIPQIIAAWKDSRRALTIAI